MTGKMHSHTKKLDTFLSPKKNKEEEETKKERKKIEDEWK